jgi:hypothetical protein
VDAHQSTKRMPGEQSAGVYIGGAGQPQ